jgi:hypothetical protein
MSPPSVSFSPATVSTTTTPPDILDLFNTEIERITRKNYEGKTFYHPVKDLTAWMEAGSPSNVSLLLATVDGQMGQTFPLNHQIGKTLVVFAILLRLGCGHLIIVFRNYVHDSTIGTTFRKEELRAALVASHLPFEDDILDRFDEQRRAFCPLDFEDIINHSVLPSGCWMLPFCVKEPTGNGGTAKVWRVLIQEDIVPKHFLDQHGASLGFIHKEFGRVCDPPSPGLLAIQGTNIFAAVLAVRPQDL